MAYSILDDFGETAVDEVKVQVNIAASESSELKPFRVKFSTQDTPRFDLWKRIEILTDQWKELKDNCYDVGLEFMASPFSNAAVDLLE